MSKLFVLCLSLLALNACASSQNIYLQDGSLGHHISCNGASLSMADCSQKAGDVCNTAGYSIVSQSSQAVPYSYASGGVSSSADKSGSHMSGGYSASSGNIIERDMFIRCNNGM